MAKLIVLSGDSIVSERSLDAEETLIGRGPDCTVLLNDPLISRHHARVVRVHTAFFIEDLNSTNGVQLNGRQVRKRLLKDGDLLRIGSHDIRFSEIPEPVETADEEPVLDRTIALTPLTARQIELHYATRRPAPKDSALTRWLRRLAGLFRSRNEPPR